MTTFNDLFEMGIDFVTGQEEFTINEEGDVVQLNENYAVSFYNAYLYSTDEEIYLTRVNVESKEDAIRLMEEWADIWNDNPDYNDFVSNFS